MIDLHTLLEPRGTLPSGFVCLVEDAHLDPQASGFFCLRHVVLNGVRCAKDDPTVRTALGTETSGARLDCASSSRAVSTQFQPGDTVLAKRFFPGMTSQEAMGPSGCEADCSKRKKTPCTVEIINYLDAYNWNPLRGASSFRSSRDEDHEIQFGGSPRSLCALGSSARIRADESTTSKWRTRRLTQSCKVSPCL